MIPNSTAYEWGFYIKPDAEKGMGQLLGNIALNHAFNKLGLEKFLVRFYHLMVSL